MKPLKYKNHTISRIERCGHRRVTINNEKRCVVKSFDGYDMDILVKDAKMWIDNKENQMVVKSPKQREIKFRAYHPKFGGMAKPEQITITGNGLWFVDYVLLHPSTNGRYSDTNGGILQQFTGLKDSKGKEIYEGDIVRLNDGPRVVYGEEIASVFYDDGRFRLRSENCIYDLCNYLNLACKVIGNIFENSELV